jgi:hypothetical protein
MLCGTQSWEGRFGEDKKLLPLQGILTFITLKQALVIIRGGPLMVAQWLRFCATNRKVAGSIPDGVTGIFHLT